MADMFAYGALDYGIRFAGFAIPPEAENLRAWYDAMGRRSSASA